MVTQAIPIERRQHPREGILGQLENITYGVLRKYGILGEARREAVMSRTPQEAREQPRTTTKRPSNWPGFRLLQRLLAARRRTGDNSRLRKKGTTMSANLVIVVNNPQPRREPCYPGTWLLYRRGRDPIEVHVAHERSDKAHVLDKGAA
ncbi:MAG TPA: hypothetical protein VEV41_05630 [Terriglobales bacterium]|nr:hypothetical protein [Terriglobales bacterium]